MNQPIRDYFYHVDLQGQLLHEGSLLADSDFLDFFFRRLRPNQTGAHLDHPYVSPCGRERNYLQAEDRPIVFQHLHDHLHAGVEGGVLGYAGSLSLPFDPTALRVSAQGRLYHPAPVGDLGLLHSRLALQLGAQVEERQGAYYLCLGSNRFLIRPC